MKKYLVLFLILISLSSYAQVTINNYKYVIVPEKFNFLKENDQYRLNTLTTALLQDKGFTVYYDNNELPNEIANNKCIALTAELEQKNTMFTTNLTLLLKDCKGNIIFKSKEGKSREKEYKVSYKLALRDAFSSLNDVQYAYTGAEDTKETVAVKKEVTVVMAPPVISAAVPAVQEVQKNSTQNAGILYAQPTANGYQLIDTTPKVLLTLLKTSALDYYIGINGPVNGIVYKRDGNWVFEYYSNGKLTSEKLVIKF